MNVSESLQEEWSIWANAYVESAKSLEFVIFDDDKWFKLSVEEKLSYVNDARINWVWALMYVLKGMKS